MTISKHRDTEMLRVAINALRGQLHGRILATERVVTIATARRVAAAMEGDQSPDARAWRAAAMATVDLLVDLADDATVRRWINVSAGIPPMSDHPLSNAT